MIDHQVHRIVVVDATNHVIGMISLSDILSFLALRPLSMERKDMEEKETETDIIKQMKRNPLLREIKEQRKTSLMEESGEENVTTDGSQDANNETESEDNENDVNKQ